MGIIHISTNIISAVNAIEAEEVEPVVDIGNEFIYWLDTSNKELSNLRYTEFNKLTGVATRSFSVRYSTYHTVQQIMFGMGLSRWQFEKPLIENFPDFEKPDIPESSIIPGCYCKR